VIFRREFFLPVIVIFIFSLFTGCVTTDEVSDNSIPQDISADFPASDGFIRLILDETTGSFSIYYMTDPVAMSYEPLFSARDPSTSYLSVSVDGNIHRLGRSNAFDTKIETINEFPALVFESSSLLITQSFAPVKTTSSQFANGVVITITIQNTGRTNSVVGLRMLLDTELSENRSEISFITSERLVINELTIEGSSGDNFWITRGENVSLMGSITVPAVYNSRIPDYIHFANWKRFNDVPWRLPYYEGRSFNFFPYSMNDSAVCYFYEPALLTSGNSFTYIIFLTTEDIGFYNRNRTALLETPSVITIAETNEPVQNNPAVPITNIPVQTINLRVLEENALAEASRTNEDPDMVTLMMLQDILNRFINDEIFLNEQDLGEIERSINRLRNRN